MGLPLVSGRKPGGIIAGDNRGKGSKIRKPIWLVLKSYLAFKDYTAVSL